MGRLSQINYLPTPHRLQDSLVDSNPFDGHSWCSQKSSIFLVCWQKTDIWPTGEMDDVQQTPLFRHFWSPLLEMKVISFEDLCLLFLWEPKLNRTFQTWIQTWMMNRECGWYLIVYAHFAWNYWSLMIAYWILGWWNRPIQKCWLLHISADA